MAMTSVGGGEAGSFFVSVGSNIGLIIGLLTIFGLIGSTFAGSGNATGGGSGCLDNSTTSISGLLAWSNLNLGMTKVSNVCSNIEQISAQISVFLLAPLLASV